MRDENPSSSSEYTVTLEFSNSRSVPLAFVLEPWGSVYELPPGGTFELRLKGPAGVPQVESSDDAIIVYAWPSSTSALFHNGERLDPEGDLPVPDLPRL
jgi:hypothetical protein